MKNFSSILDKIQTFSKYGLVVIAFIKALELFIEECKTIDFNNGTEPTKKPSNVEKLPK